MGRIAVLILLWAAGTLGTAQTPADSDALLEEIKARARVNLSGLPDYICLQTVDRMRKDHPAEEYQPVDTIRVEVGLMGDRELFAWPDSERFEDQELADLINHGTIGNGNFALHARNVFLTDAPDFTYIGEEELNGRSVHKYDFEVPVERSTYHLRVRPFQARVAFRGSFWADTETLDLVQLFVLTDDIPQQLGLVEARDLMEYARVPIGDSDALLPKASELQMMGIKGTITRNRSTFHGCRQYVGESSISFNAAPSDAPPAPPRDPTTFALPENASLELALESAIDPRDAVIGDPVRALVAKPLREGQRVLVPKGAVAHGRLVRLERYDQPVDHFLVGLEFHSIEFGGQRAEFEATMRRASGSSALVKQERRLDPTFRKRRKASLQILVNETQEGLGILHWKAEKPVIQPGLKMVWEVISGR